MGFCKRFLVTGSVLTGFGIGVCAGSISAYEIVTKTRACSDVDVIVLLFIIQTMTCAVIYYVFRKYLKKRI